ncbi:MAG: hypothetical protein HYT49_03590 [Candidatus Wildermuthbacteria bacterium]|nr:hypothetical protein [Candidatus Wildermuthbacteria bacterium]
MSNELYTFVKEALEKGQSRSAIQQALQRAGWQQEEVQKALASFAEVSFPVPVPKPKPYLQAREAFLFLISFITLYTTAFSFGILIFAFIEKLFPDPVSYGFFSPRGLTTALASIIIAFPLYLFMMWRLAKAASKDPERRQSKVGKWLTYITLVIAAGIIIGDLIAVLASLLSGELTSRFVLKALTVLAIAGSIFGYYLWSLQKEEKEKPAQSPKGIKAGPPQSGKVSLGGEKPIAARIFAGMVVVAVASAVVYGLTLVGTPAQQRLIQFDERRISDLQQITYAIDSYWERNKSLPESLEDLRDPRYYVQSLSDPKTGEPYEYQLTSATAYEICATFEAVYPQDEAQAMPRYSGGMSFWDHGIGRTCFSLEVRKLMTPTGEIVPVPVKP